MIHHFIAVDIETTGLDPNRDHIIEIAAVEFTDGRESASFSRLINPGHPISPFISQLTGILNQDLKTAPSIASVISEFHTFCRDLPLVFYNAPFDAAFIRREMAAAGVAFSNPILDVLVLARSAWPFLTSYKLKDSAETWEVTIDKVHRAESDARMTGLLFLKFNQFWIHQSLEIMNTLANFFINTDSVYTDYFRELLTTKGGTHPAPEYQVSLPDLPQPESNAIQAEGSDFDYPERLEDFFKPGGLISRQLDHYEYRHIQETMAEFILKSFEEETIGITEAATGTGKSFAYLIPAILFSTRSRQPVLISTKTKNLQDQLFFKDIPFIHHMVNESFSSAILKGRNNYFCRKKYTQFLEFQLPHLPPALREQILPVVIYQAYTQTGDLGEIGKSDPTRSIARYFSSDTISCFPRSCPHKRECYYYRARQQAMQAQIVITNHSLLMAELTIENSFIHDFQHLIIDEAHQLEKTAVSFLGQDMSYHRIGGLLDFYCLNPHDQYVLLKRLLHTVQTQNFYGFEVTAQLENSVNEMILLASRLDSECRNLFDQVRTSIQPPKGSGYSIHSRIRQPFDDHSAEMTRFTRIEKLITALLDGIKAIHTIVEEKAEEYGLEEYCAGLDALSVQLGEIRQFLDDFLHCRVENRVHWVEIEEKEKYPELHSWPVQIDRILQEQLFGAVKSIVLVSATLTINQNFIYCKRRLGLEDIEAERINELVLEPVFQLDQQVMICLPTFLPDPAQTQSFTQQSAELLNYLIPIHKRGCLILFTSYSMMQDFHQRMKPHFEQHGIKLMMQNRKSSTQHLLREFKENESSVLLGTESFWEGVDVPGKALEVVVITKLPFQVPDEPIIEARLEYLQQQNKNPFYHYTLPEAIIRLKQGLGRLIRHRDDTGIILILDKRVRSAAYGRFIENSLPVPLKTAGSRDAMERLFRGWFDH
ncbi:MAG: ribonuclease H-like domain-containing protein [Candidatus Delongbacteria bacterium]|nr:ribonuclease H-like domain-containing protein [Candidatus Delongbacteria bacterium]